MIVSMIYKLNRKKYKKCKIKMEANKILETKWEQIKI